MRLGISFLCTAALLLTACSSAAGGRAAADTDQTYIVTLSAQPEAGYILPQTVQFSGSCLVSTASGSESKTVNGSTPMSLNYRGRSISCSFQKQEGNKVIFHANVSRSGISQKDVDTSAQYGIVSFVVGQ